MNSTKNMFVDGDEVSPKKKKKAPAEEAHAHLPSGENFLNLPSKGKLWYESTVSYREIMVKDEEILSLATEQNYAKTLNSVIKSVLNDCSFYENLTVYDRDYILVWLWANNFSSIKEVEVTCQHCSKKEVHKIDLTKTPTTDIKDNIPVPFTIPISKTKGNISVRLNTVQDELTVEEYMNKHPESNMETLMLAASIDLGVHMNFENKVEWVRENISSKELGYVKQFHRYFKFGVDDTVEHVCTECKGVTRGPLPFHAEDILFPEAVSGNFEDLLRIQQADEDTSE